MIFDFNQKLIHLSNHHYISHVYTYPMWLILLAGILQGLLISERVLYRILLIFVVSKRSQLKKHADNQVIGSMWSATVVYLTLPVQLVLSSVDIMLKNSTVFAVIFMFLLLLFLASNSLSQLLVKFVNTYNSGLGQTLDLYIKAIQLPSYLFQAFLPIYNGLIYFSSLIFRHVVLPFTRVNVGVLPELAEKASLWAGSIAVTVTTWLRHILSCTTGDPDVEVPTEKFLEQNLQCIGNVNYFYYDAMTPGIYSRQIALTLSELVQQNCGPIALLFKILIYPLLDYNLYKSVHCVINTVINAFVALPLQTYWRCKYALENPNRYTELERNVMCVPDFETQYAVSVGIMVSLGKLLDNWLNVAWSLGKESIVGPDQYKVCKSSYHVRHSFDRAESVFVAPKSQLKVVGISEQTFAITDGYSTEYHSTSMDEDSEFAIGNWPFPVNVRYGIAAIQANEEIELKLDGTARTGLLGCRCLDFLSETNIPRISVLCASVPYSNFHDNETMYNASTLQYVNFGSPESTDYMTCASTRIRVSSLRFSRKRESRGYVSTDSVYRQEGNYMDAFDTLGVTGSRDGMPLEADAAIYVSPKCDPSVPSIACIAKQSNCFPYCLGLHLSGQSQQNITMHNERRWSEYVNVQQTDCFSAEPKQCGTEVDGVSTNLEFGVIDQLVCNSRCSPSAHSETWLDRNQILQKAPTASPLAVSPTIRLEEQPFVAAGDIILSSTDGHVYIDRLYDNNRGLFTYSAEKLSVSRVDKDNMIKQCDNNDNDCYHSAIPSQIVEPNRYMFSSTDSFVSAVSEFGVHWADNPDPSQWEVQFARCTSTRLSGSDQITGKGRVWTLRPVRRDSGDTNGLVSFMTIPDWVTASTSCDEMVHVKIVDIEYMNADNVLVTVLKVAPKHFDVLRGSVREGAPYQHSFFFMHPSRFDCVDSDDPSNRAVYSCWQDESKGMFRKSENPEFSDVYGALCPAMQVMPQLGAMFSEVGIAFLGLTRILLETAVVMPASFAANSVGELFSSRVDKITFHSVLDRSGASLFDVDMIVNPIDRAMMFAAQTLPRLGNMLRGVPGQPQLQRVLLGSAKVLQHTAQIERRMLQMEPVFLAQLTALQDAIPTAKTLDTAAEAVSPDSVLSEGTKKPTLQESAKRFVGSTTAALKTNARLLKIVVIRILQRLQSSSTTLARNSRAISAGVTDIMSMAGYEASKDIERSLLDSMRTQCDGVGQIIGRNVYGNIIKNACMIVPDGIQSILTALLIFVVDYPVVDCICREHSGKRADVIQQQCLARNRPASLQALSLEVMASSEDTAQAMCFEFMDKTNERLIGAFDLLFYRMYRVTELTEASFDALLSPFDSEAGQCSAVNDAAFAVTIMPSPVDYFMGCSETYDCRVKCLPEMTAFNEAYDTAMDKPLFVTEKITAHAESRFFSDDDIEQNLHLAPFEILGMVELPENVCSTICSETLRSKCIFVSGVNNSQIQGKYYCMPYNFEASVFAYDATLPAYESVGEDEEVRDIQILSMDAVTTGYTEFLLVMTANATDDTFNLYAFTKEGRKFLIAQTNRFATALNDPNSFYSFTSAHVVPTVLQKQYVSVYLQGTKISLPEKEEIGLDSTFTTVNECRFIQIRIGYDADELHDDFTGYMTSWICPQSTAEQQQDMNDPTLKVLCMDVLNTRDCEQRLLLPTASSQNPMQIRLVQADDTVTTFAFENFQDSIARTLSLDSDYALIQGTQGQAFLNRKVIASNVPNPSACAINADSSCLTLIIAGKLNMGTMWLHTIRLELDTENAKSTASVLGGLDVNFDYQVKLDCSIQSCGGCMNRERDAKFIDLQNKCYAAAECAVRKCVGTEVNMNRPLCNLGKVMQTSADAARVATQGAWNAIAQNIIVIVELSASRRDRYVISFPQETFTAAICNSKDAVVEISSLLTSFSGAIITALHRNRNQVFDLDIHDAGMDVRVFGKRIMLLTAITNLFSSLLMGPLYGIIALAKTVECRLSSFIMIFNTVSSGISNMAGSDTFVTIQSGTDRQKKLSDDLVGVCMSEYGNMFTKDLTRTNTLAGMVGEVMTHIRHAKKTWMHEYVVHNWDAALSYAYGIVTGMMDVAQVADWSHCKMPSLVNADVSECVCGDKKNTIPPALKRAKAGDGAHTFWCSGFLLMTGLDGAELLVWNPYSLQELLDAGDFQAYINCMKSSTECNSRKPKLPLLTAQNIDVLQVITRCRANYQQKQWDDGAVFMGMFDLETWQQAPRSLDLPFNYDSDYWNRISRRISSISQAMNLNMQQVVDESTLACLNASLIQNTPSLSCMRQHLETANNPVQATSTDTYYLYEESTTESIDFKTTDACEVFSGNMLGYSQDSSVNITFPAMVWTGNSRNKVPVAKFHFYTLQDQATRYQEAENELRILLEEKIVPELHRLPLSLSEKIETKAWSFEADDLHQLIDCIVLGPYAAADLQSSFTLQDGHRLPVEQYHRGSPTSRQFYPGENLATGGSQARQNIIGNASKYIEQEYTGTLKDTALNKVHVIRNIYRDITNFYCTCSDGSSKLDCCATDRVQNIQFKALTMFADIWNMKDDVTSESWTRLLESGTLDKIWSSTDFEYRPDYKFSDAQIEELHNKYVFDTASVPQQKTIREYSDAEVLKEFTAEPLRQRCLDLLSASFFTMPIKVGDEMQVDAEFDLDPTRVNSTLFTHGMELGIQKLLKQSREKSPLFWTHVHRYVASDSVWCEDIQQSQIHARNYSHYNTPTVFEGISMHAHTIAAPNINQVTHVRDLLSTCACGSYYDAETQQCRMHTCWNVSLPVALQAQYDRLCEVKTYTSREDALILIRVLDEAASIDASWIKNCSEFQPSVTWGLLDSKLHGAWYASQSMSPDISLQEVATYGAAGLRLHSFASTDDIVSDKAKQYMRRDQDFPRYNAHYAHTIAQPICANNLGQVLHDDLSQHFQDVFFPMAHAVHESTVSTYCSTWVVEHAILAAFEKLNISTDVIIEQSNRELAWRERCELQLQQIGICELRGVFDLEGEQVVPSHCEFGIDDSHGCSHMYVTENCLVKCDGFFYDPCFCNASKECSEITFTKTSCPEIQMDPRKFARNEHVKLFSMHWPHELLENEAVGNLEEQNEELHQIRMQLKETFFNLTDLLHEFSDQVVERDSVITEGTAPEYYCDDLFDYMDTSSHYPVGYHPTCACNLSETRMRGFAAYMFQGDEHDVIIDPVRLRNMTLFSTEFGASHIICDASAYGANAVPLQQTVLQSKWNGADKVDPAVPVKIGKSELQAMHTISQQADSVFDTPLVQVDDFMQHSAGLVRNWLRWYGEDSDINQNTLNELWPHWGWQQEDEFVGTVSDTSQELCSHPLLHTCNSDEDCATDNVTLVCLRPGDEEEGVCMQKGTCFRHSHCDADRMCSGEGRCADPYIIIQNERDTEIECQIFTDDATCVNCESMQGTSRFENIVDFAQSNGMCSMRNWHVYVNTTSKATNQGSTLLVRKDSVYYRPTDETPQSIEENNILTPYSDKCDRSYHHHFGYKFLQPQERTESFRGVKTSTEDSVKFCNMNVRSKELDVVGFLDPFKDKDGIDTLKNVPALVSHCTNFEVCQASFFSVQGQRVRRRVAEVTKNKIFKTTNRLYQHNDADLCFGAGYRLNDECTEDCECVVDRWTLPLLQLLDFSDDSLYPKILSAEQPLDEIKIKNRYDEIILKCPHAFEYDVLGLDRKGETLFRWFIRELSDEYSSSSRTEITDKVNRFILSLFGLTIDGLENRGFDDLDQYFAHTECLQFLIEQNAVLTQATADFVYYDNRNEFNTPPGQSLYLFQDRSAIEIPWMWFLKCVLLSKGIPQGGAQQNWFDIVTNVKSADELKCLNYDANEANTVKDLLQRSDFIWQQPPETISDVARGTFLNENTIIHDINIAIASVLNELKIPSKPNVDKDRTCQFKQDCNLLNIDPPECVTRTINENSEKLEPQDQTNLYRFVYQELTGTENPDTPTILDLEKANLVRKLDVETNIADNTVMTLPMYQFTALMITHQSNNTLRGQYTDGDCDFYDNHAEENEYARIDKSLWDFDDFEGHNWHILPESFVKYLILKSLRQRMYFTSIFKDLNINADLQSSSYIRKYDDYELHHHVQDFREFNRFMQEKQYPCSEENTVDLSETNDKNRLLRECYEDLQVNLGWKISRKAENGRREILVRKNTLNGFYITYQDTHPGASFIKNMTTLDLSERNNGISGPFRNWICYEENTRAKLLSPLWAGDFDTTTCSQGLSCGCDTYIDTDGTRLVDTRCKDDDDQCRNEFPVYYDLITLETKPQCKDLALQSQPVAMPQRGSLDPDQDPLCDREQIRLRELQQQAECTVSHGSFHGHVGTEANLINPERKSISKLSGLFSANNPIFKYQRNVAFDDGLQALAVLDSDIGGHVLEFEITSNGFLFFKCAHLQSSVNDDTCDEFRRGRWLRNIESAWQSQHDFLANQWSKTIATKPPWKCPLYWITAYSNSSKSYAASTQHARRNQQRFQHLTQSNYYAHPVISSAFTLDTLQKAHFLADNHVCTDFVSCKNQLNSVLSDLVQMASEEGWKILALHQSTGMCQKLLDWPHQDYRLRDKLEIESQFDSNECSVLDRLPSFALRYVQADYSSLLQKPKASSANVCRMQPLTRVKHDTNWPSNRTIQYCTSREKQIECVYLESDGTTHKNGTYLFDIEDPYTRLKNQTYSRKRHCAQCERTSVAYINRSLGHESSESIHSLMSFGQPVQLRTARILASHIRQHVCADEVLCPNCSLCLQRLFDSDDWKSGSFLQQLMNLKSDNILSSPSPINDDALWNRPWLFCNASDSGDVNLGTCTGNIDKAKWLNASTRASECSTVLQNVARPEAHVQFCLLDATTEKLCNDIADWNSEIVGILCRAAGTCRDSGFHYVPTAYMVSNQEFVSQSISNYYTDLNDSACPSIDRDQAAQDQIEINQRHLQKCASVAMQPLRMLIEAVRQVIRKVWRVFYYYMMIGSQWFQIIAGMFVPNAAGGKEMIEQGFKRMIQYVTLLMESIVDIFNLIIFSLWEMLASSDGSFGKVMVTILQAVCEAIKWVKETVICPVMEWLANALMDIGEAIDKIPFVSGQWLIDGSKDLLVFTQAAFCNAITCSLPKCDGERSAYGYKCNAAEQGRLPLPTRCWSSYLTFFGDSDTLGCTGADTCRKNLLGNEHTVCALCQASPNYKAFGCSATTQTCTCNVPNYVQTPCLSNDECVQNQEATCRFLDWDYMPSQGTTECSACQTERVCYLDVNTDQRFCACGLQNTLKMARCNAVDRGRAIMPASSDLCAYDANRRYASNTRALAEFSQLSVMPCSYADGSQSFCTLVEDQSSYMIIAGSDNSNLLRRRLLSANDSSTEDLAALTRNPSCQSAFVLDGQSAEKLQCLASMQLSARTVSSLNATAAIADCTFCSRHDFFHELLHNPAMLPVILNIDNVALIMQRHSSLGYAWQESKVLLLKLSLLQDNVGDWNDLSIGNISSSFSLLPMRRLLGVDALLAARQNMIDIHNDYATAIASAYDYRFNTESSAAGDAWSVNWPPAFTPGASEDCETLSSLLQIMVDSAEKTVLPYTQQGQNMQATPAKYLKDSWPNVTRSAERTNNEDFSIVGGILFTFLKWCGVEKEALSDFGIAVFDELNLFLSCDIDAVQVCSRWRVKLIHSIIIMTVICCVSFVILNQFQLGFLAFGLMATFTTGILFMSYGYSPFCFPMIPMCFTEDLIDLLQIVFPKVVYVPTPLLHTENSLCKPMQLQYNSSCIRSCTSTIFEYDGWEGVYAWTAAELGIVEWSISQADTLLLVDASKLKRLLRLKKNVFSHGNAELINANRICAALHSYELIPVLFGILALLASMAVLATILPTLVYPAMNVLTSLYVSIFVSN